MGRAPPADEKAAIETWSGARPPLPIPLFHACLQTLASPLPNHADRFWTPPFAPPPTPGDIVIPKAEGAS